MKGLVSFKFLSVLERERGTAVQTGDALQYKLEV